MWPGPVFSEEAAVPILAGLREMRIAHFIISAHPQVNREEHRQCGGKRQ